MANRVKKHIPNIITTIRLILAIIFAITFIDKNFFLAFVIFAIASSSDALDGYLARKWQVLSDYGKRIDPIADKLLAGLALILLSIFINPLFLLILVLELFITINGLLLYTKKEICYVSTFGKVKTAFLFTAISLTILSESFSILNIYIYILIILTIILQIISIKGYVAK